MSGPINAVATIAALRASTSTTLVGSTCYVEGYYAAVDGGEGMFTNVAASVHADDGGSCIIDASGRHWLRAIKYSTVSVDDFGAIGDGATANGTAFQNAINWANTNPGGGGKVIVECKRYAFGTSEHLTVPGIVTLAGAITGWFGGYSDPESQGPTLLITNTATTFLSITGEGNAEDLIYYYPNQVTWAASTPTVYPPTITLLGSGAVRRSYGINPYQFISIQTGRCTVEGIQTGAIQNAISVDHCEDYTYIDKVCVSTYPTDAWPAGAGAFPTALDNWILRNRIGISFARCDSFKMSNVGIFGSQTGIQFIDSPDRTQPTYFNAYGEAVNIDIDTCEYGVIAYSTNTDAGGVKFVNLNIGATIAAVGPKSAILTVAGGTQQPWITWIGGGCRGVWANGAVNSSAAGRVYYEQVRGLNPVSQGVVTPPVPASGVNYTNETGLTIEVHIASSTGSFTHVYLQGVGIGSNTTSFLLRPFDTVQLVYTGSASWEFFGS